MNLGTSLAEARKLREKRLSRKIFWGKYCLSERKGMLSTAKKLGWGATGVLGVGGHDEKQTFHCHGHSGLSKREG